MDNEKCVTSSGGSHITATGLQLSHKFGEKFRLHTRIIVFVRSPKEKKNQIFSLNFL